MFAIRVPRAGLAYSDVYEWREAARWVGGGTPRYWEEFCELESDEQSAIVAHFQTHRQIDAVLAKDAARRNKRR